MKLNGTNHSPAFPHAPVATAGRTGISKPGPYCGREKRGDCSPVCLCGHMDRRCGYLGSRELCRRRLKDDFHYLEWPQGFDGGPHCHGLRAQTHPDADITIYNGFQTAEDFPLCEGDTVAFLRKGVMPKPRRAGKPALRPPYPQSPPESESGGGGRCRAGRIGLPGGGVPGPHGCRTAASGRFRRGGTKQSEPPALRYAPSRPVQDRGPAGAAFANQPLPHGGNPDGPGDAGQCGFPVFGLPYRLRGLRQPRSKSGSDQYPCWNNAPACGSLRRPAWRDTPPPTISIPSANSKACMYAGMGIPKRSPGCGLMAPRWRYAPPIKPI